MQILPALAFNDFQFPDGERSTGGRVRAFLSYALSDDRVDTITDLVGKSEPAGIGNIRANRVSFATTLSNAQVDFALRVSALKA